jgi:serine/threonine protein kinase
MAYDDQAMEGLRAPLSSGFNLRRFTGEDSLLNPVSTIEDKKDLVTFLEALNSILESRDWLDFSFVNALDGAYLGGGATFTVRKHILQRRIHSYPHRLVPGNVVVLKIAHGGFSKGRTSTDNTTSQQMDALIREIQIMAHPPVRSNSSIVDLLQLMWEFDKNVLRPVLVLEFAELGTAGEYLRSGRRLNEDEKNTIIEGVADGLQVLHKSGIIHGDVKCDNVLLFRSKVGALMPKLTDFGYSILLSEVKSGSSATVGGTEPFTAPETRWPVERSLLYSTDYFAYGMMVWQTILDGSDLFSASPFSAPAKELSDKHWRLYIREAKESPDFVANVKASIKSYAKSDASQNVEQLLESLLCRDPATRSMENAFKS